MVKPVVREKLAYDGEADFIWEHSLLQGSDFGAGTLRLVPVNRWGAFVEEERDSDVGRAGAGSAVGDGMTLKVLRGQCGGTRGTGQMGSRARSLNGSGCSGHCVCVCIHAHTYIHIIYICCCSVAKLCPTLCDPMGRDCSMPGSPVLHYLLEFVQIHVHWVSDTIQPSHPLSSPSPFAFNLSSIRVFSDEAALCIRWPKYWVIYTYYNIYHIFNVFLYIIIYILYNMYVYIIYI